MKTFDEWYAVYGEEALIRFAENGAVREMCFDLEAGLIKEYEKFIKENE